MKLQCFLVLFLFQVMPSLLDKMDPPHNPLDMTLVPAQDKLPSYNYSSNTPTLCLAVEICVVCGDRASGKSKFLFVSVFQQELVANINI